MRNLLLSAALIVAPVGLFAGAYILLVPVTTAPAIAATADPSLGDLSAMAAIVADVQSISSIGDFTAAQKRITDFETAWDDNAGRLRPINTLFWGNIDTAADAALGAVRAGNPDPAQISTTLADLAAELADPARMPGAAAPVAIASVGGVATTDANGRALPCEVMIKDLAGRLTTVKLPADTLAQINDLQTKALERCNADDDARADGFSAHAIALIPAN